MRYGYVILLVIAGLFFIKLAYAQSKDGSLENQLNQIAAKLDAMEKTQAKLDTILANQETMLQMLRIIRSRT